MTKYVVTLSPFDGPDVVSNVWLIDEDKAEIIAMTLGQPTGESIVTATAVRSLELSGEYVMMMEDPRAD